MTFDRKKMFRLALVKIPKVKSFPMLSDMTLISPHVGPVRIHSSYHLTNAKP